MQPGVIVGLRRSLGRGYVQGHIKKCLTKNDKFRLKFDHFAVSGHHGLYEVRLRRSVYDNQAWKDIHQLINQGILIEYETKVLVQESTKNGGMRWCRKALILTEEEKEVQLALGTLEGRLKNAQVTYCLNEKLRKWYQQLTGAQRAILFRIDRPFRGKNGCTVRYKVCRNLQTNKWLMYSNKVDAEKRELQKKDIQFFISQGILVESKEIVNANKSIDFILSERYKKIKFLIKPYIYSEKAIAVGEKEMSNKGYNFEADEVDFWRLTFPEIDKEYIFRVEGSGRSKNATKTGSQSMLEGDVSLELKKAGILPKDILIECKHYKTSSKKKTTSNRVMKSFSIKKEWVDQALHEAEHNGRFSIVAIKFKGVRPNEKELTEKYCWADGHFGNSIHYVIPQHHFVEIIRYICGIKDRTTVDLSQVSTDDLFDELKKRLKKG